MTVKLHSLWNTGWETAPPLVTLARHSWANHASNYEINLLEADDLEAAMRELGLAGRNIPIQAASDIFRTYLLHEQGGLWLDATCLLNAPLADWLPGLQAPSGFFAFTRPGPDRLLASWCLAAQPKSKILEGLLADILDYWSRDRRVYSGFDHLSRFNRIGRRRRIAALHDPLWAISPTGYGRTGFAPYFWFHYHFARHVSLEGEAGQIWSRTPKISAVPALTLEQVLRNGDADDLERSSVETVLQASPVHKLNWRLDLPPALEALLLGKT